MRLFETILTIKKIRIQIPDKNGKLDDVILGFDNISDYLGDGNSHLFGSTVGRVASRISYATISIDGITYNLTTNDGPHHNDVKYTKVC